MTKTELTPRQQSARAAEAADAEALDMTVEEFRAAYPAITVARNP